MDIDKVREEKNGLEIRLQDLIHKELQGFAERTGVEVDSVHVSLSPVHVTGEKGVRYFLEVRCDITL